MKSRDNTTLGDSNPGADIVVNSETSVLKNELLSLMTLSVTLMRASVRTFRKVLIPEALLRICNIMYEIVL
jgi:hypothetical protein